MDARLLAKQLDDQIARRHPEWRVRALEPHAAGLDSLVCRAESAAFGPIAIKTPWQRVISNDNDPEQDARTLLEQERALTSWMEHAGALVPRVFALELCDEERDFLVTAFETTDGTAPGGESIGRVMRGVHDAPPFGGPLVAQTEVSAAQTVALRMPARVEAVERATGERFGLPPASELVALLTAATQDTKTSVLHMDVRPANLLTREGVVVGIVDWANALSGDPALDLARIAEYGHLDDAFVRSYGRAPFADVPRATELLYRLDTVVMLANVFLSEAPDPALARKKVARLHELMREFSTLHM